MSRISRLFGSSTPYLYSGTREGGVRVMILVFDEDYFRYRSGATKLDIIFKEDEQQINLSPGISKTATSEYKTLVQKIAKAFDEELLSGKHQEHFGRIVSETKRILSK